MVDVRWEYPVYTLAEVDGDGLICRTLDDDEGECVLLFTDLDLARNAAGELAQVGRRCEVRPIGSSNELKSVLVAIQGSAGFVSWDMAVLENRLFLARIESVLNAIEKNQGNGSEKDG